MVFFFLRFKAPSPNLLYKSVLLFLMLTSCILAIPDDLIAFLTMSNGQGGDDYNGTEGKRGHELQAHTRAIYLKCDLHTKKLGL